MAREKHSDYYYLKMALAEAKKGRYTTSPNPAVGCVIVRNNKILGMGFHHCAGQPHAEVMALRAAGFDVEGATCYVTLEPCSHHGRTPPCAQALIDARVKKVVIGSTDPDPRVSGKGIRMLLDANIQVVVATGRLNKECIKLNRAFFKSITTGRPFTILKYGMSLDGRVALSTNESKWITNDRCRADVQRLRLWSDAVITSYKTVLTDNPKLNVRLEDLPIKLLTGLDTTLIRQPVKVIIDSKGTLMPNRQLYDLDPYAIFSTGENFIVVGSTELTVAAISDKNKAKPERKKSSDKKSDKEAAKEAAAAAAAAPAARSAGRAAGRAATRGAITTADQDNASQTAAAFAVEAGSRDLKDLSRAGTSLGAGILERDDDETMPGHDSPIGCFTMAELRELNSRSRSGRGSGRGRKGSDDQKVSVSCLKGRTLSIIPERPDHSAIAKAADAARTVDAARAADAAMKADGAATGSAESAAGTGRLPSSRDEAQAEVLKLITNSWQINRDKVVAQGSNFVVEKWSDRVYVVAVPFDLGTDGKAHASVSAVLDFLGSRDIRVAMVEAGSTLGSAFLEHGLIDECYCYMSPMILGLEAKSAFAIHEPSRLAEALRFKKCKVKTFKSNIGLVLSKPVTRAHRV